MPAGDELLALLYARAKVSVAPLLAGAGVKGKVKYCLIVQPARKPRGAHAIVLRLFILLTLTYCSTRFAKVNQAMKLGVPVVATRIAVEGMHVEHGRECLIADSPEDFASDVVKLYTDCELWSRLVTEAHRNIQQHFSVDVARKQLMEALKEANLTTSRQMVCVVETRTSIGGVTSMKQA
jgi:glycosyltransferase involved in cell wall biosynthesis